jgi:hypothetical protein
MAVQESWTSADLAGRRDVIRSPHDGGASSRFQFGLSTLLLFFTLAAIVFGIFAVAPGLGVFVGLLVMGGFIGVIRQSARMAARGIPLSGEGKIGAFWLSVGYTFIILAAIAVVAAVVIVVGLFIICSGMGHGSRH